MNLWINDINSEIINNFVIRKEDQLVFNKTNVFLGWQYQVNYIVSYYSEDFLSLLIRKDEYSISDKPDVSFSTSNIEFAFPPGIVAPAEDGAYFVKIPYDYIAPYTNPSGLLNRFIKNNGINYLEFSPDKINR